MIEIPEKLQHVLKYEGIVAIVSQGPDEPHVANTWNRYIRINSKGQLLAPAGGMKNTEQNVIKNSRIKVTIGSREVKGFHSQGTGFLIKATAHFVSSGDDYALMKEKFPWCRAVLVMEPYEIIQTL